MAIQKIQNALKGDGWVFLKYISKEGSVNGNIEINGVTTIVIQPNNLNLHYIFAEIEKMSFVRDKKLAIKNFKNWYEKFQPSTNTTIKLSVLNSGDISVTTIN